MSEKQSIRMVRFVRRGFQADMPNTFFTACMRAAWDRMWEQEWRKALTNPEETRGTGNNFRLSEYDYDWIDSCRQWYNTGRSEPQMSSTWIDVMCSMASYQLVRPLNAGTDPWKKVRCQVNVDKFALDGVKVSVFLSNNPVPPHDFESCRNGGTDDEPELAGRMSTPDVDHDFDILKWEYALVRRDEDGNIVPPPPKGGSNNGKQSIAHPDNSVGCNIPARIGVLAATDPTINQNPPGIGEFEFDLSHITKPYQFCYVTISMFGVDPWRTQYFCEGSGFISYRTIEAEIGSQLYAVSAELFIERHGWRQALNMEKKESGGTGETPYKVVNEKTLFRRYKFTPININDEWFSIDWGVKMSLQSGNGNLFPPEERQPSTHTDPALNQLDNWPYLAPVAFIVRDSSKKPVSVQVRRSECYMACPRNIPAGSNLWLRKFEPWIGEHTKLRITVKPGNTGFMVDMHRDRKDGRY